MRSTCCHRGPWKDISLSDAALPGRETEIRGHSEHVPAVQGAPREYERCHGHGNGSSRGRRVSCLLFGAAVMERS